MVLFIKEMSLTNAVDKICKMMINIETNEYIYDIDGNEYIQPKKNFNRYSQHEIEFDITPSIGQVLIYNDQYDVNLIMPMILDKFDELDKNENIIGPVNYKSYKSTYYTLINGVIKNDGRTCLSNNGSSRRKIITSKNNLKRVSESGSKFTWLIHYSKSSAIMVSELSDKVPSKEYLIMSLSTIILDMSCMFNVTDGHKQIDYPLLTQYNMYLDQKILNTSIYLSKIYGLDYEIMRHYTNKVCELFKIETFKKKIKTIKFDTNIIKKRNPLKKWYLQLFNNEENHIDGEYCCFITKTPLYGEFYIIKIAHILNRDNIFNIPVLPYFIHGFKCNKYPNIDAYFRKHNFVILDLFISVYNKSECDVIKSMDISELKRDIMLSISINGCLETSDRKTRVNLIYTINIEKPSIYIGVVGTISDYEIMKYNNTNTILFHCLM